MDGDAFGVILAARGNATPNGKEEDHGLTSTRHGAINPDSDGRHAGWLWP